MEEEELFDEWPERYEQWFTTPVGKLVLETETRLVMDLLRPALGEKILDAGCGTGVFTLDFLRAGASVIGLDISAPMLKAAVKKTAGYDFSAIKANMEQLPFTDNSFDKSVSITALEFIENGKNALDELFRVTRTGGWVMVATLNSLSPWAARRRAKTESGQRHILEAAFFRSPGELLSLSHYRGIAKTVVHFQKDDEPRQAVYTEELGIRRGLDTGAFVAALWRKPG